MLSPVNNILYLSLNYSYKKFAKNKNSNNVYADYKSIYKNSINFTHYMGLNSDITQNPEYFKLPSVQLQNGQKHQFQPDKSQVDCAKKLLNGDSVIYCAPTGTGKTAVAHFAVNKNLKNNKKTIITVPLVALANDKYREFCKIYGTDNIGIMTGDRKINPNASIVIMTTEILYNQSSDLKDNSKDIGTVVFDEAHYLSDAERGSVWEKSLIECLKNDVQVLCLSATIGNCDEFTNWIQKLNEFQTASKVEIKPQERYVPLIWQVYNPKDENKFIPFIQYAVDIENLSYETLTDKQNRAIDIIYQVQNKKNEFYKPTEKETKETINSLKSSLRNWYQSAEDFEEDFQEAYKFDSDKTCEIAHLLRDENDTYVKHLYVQSQAHDDFPNLIKDLDDKNKLPALIFKLSREKCDDVAKNLNRENIELTTEDEKKQIKKIIDEHSKKGYLGKDIKEDDLMRGFGVHHAGKLPECRKLVEDLFSKKLLKVVIATSTLGAGINMPAKTVVLSDMTYRKYNPHSQEIESSMLEVNEFHQMAGRAGRRGIDSTGNVILYNLKAIANKFKNEKHNRGKIDELELAYQYVESKSNNLISRFRPDPVMIARYYNENGDNSALYDVVNNSFKMYSAKDKEKLADATIKKFENYNHILLKQGYLYRDYKNQYVLTPKGKLLLNAMGANPLMSVNLIYDEHLKDVTPESLAQIAGYIAGSDDIQETQGIDSAVIEMLTKQLNNSKKEIKEFKKTRQLYKDKEDRLLKILKESKLPLNDIISSDNISGYITYLWANFNNKNENSIENFENISKINYETDEKEIKSALNAKLSEGNIYRAISHSISVLKQIQRICEYALENPIDYPDVDYYKALFNKASEAIDLMEQEPIRKEDFS